MSLSPFENVPAIRLQPLNAPLSAPVRAVLEYDKKGERNPLVHVWNDDPAQMEALERFFPLTMEAGAERCEVAPDVCGDYSAIKRAMGAPGSATREAWNARQAEAQRELSALLSHPSFYLAILPLSL